MNATPGKPTRTVLVSGDGGLLLLMSGEPKPTGPVYSPPTCDLGMIVGQGPLEFFDVSRINRPADRGRW
jgi:hypothetical protein